MPDTLPPPTDTGLHTRFILIQTSHAGNVGAAARAMKTMGFDDLVDDLDAVFSEEPDTKIGEDIGEEPSKKKKVAGTRSYHKRRETVTDE